MPLTLCSDASWGLANLMVCVLLWVSCREVYTHRFVTGALFPRGGHGRRRKNEQEAMVCFKDAAIHCRRDWDSVFLEVRSLIQRPGCFLGHPGLC